MEWDEMERPVLKTIRDSNVLEECSWLLTGYTAVPESDEISLDCTALQEAAVTITDGASQMTSRPEASIECNLSRRQG